MFVAQICVPFLARSEAAVTTAFSNNRHWHLGWYVQFAGDEVRSLPERRRGGSQYQDLDRTSVGY